MQQIEIRDWPAQLNVLLAELAVGEEVVLTTAQRPIAKLIKLEDSEVKQEDERGAKLADLLEQLASQDAFREIADPVAWQREIRQDRALPERE
jgi:antitoxin (DNA-binding transcriptional repressor) of toxin-antitoxin stability system